MAPTVTEIKVELRKFYVDTFYVDTLQLFNSR